MGIVIGIIGIAMIIWEEANKNVLTPAQQKKLLEMKPLADRDRELWEQVFGKKKNKGRWG